MREKQGGYTLVELMVSMIVLGIIALAAFQLLTAQLNSAIIAKRQSVAYTLATTQLEYLKQLPYDSLAVAGGSIPASTTIPGSFTKKVNGDTYTVKTAITYSDDAYDGCGSYPTQALKEQYCRNYPAPSGAPNPDTNPADNKIASVIVTDVNGVRQSFLDTIISARVAETASNTGALFIKIVDEGGNPVSGATVNVVNNSLTPAINVSDTTDQNGVSLFYGLSPDTTNYDYNVTASKSNYSSLTTIVPSGSLQPTYSNQNLIAQNSVLVTLKIMPQGANSLVAESTDTNGVALPNAKIYIKGGYKRYTATADTSYYYDNLRSSDSRPTTDANGLAAISNLVPGEYIFCGDNGDASCTVGGTTYYLAAAVPYGGSNTLNPITVPTYSTSNPPNTTFAYNSNNYLQKVRLMLTSNVNFPRVQKITPASVDLSSDPVSNLSFTLTGVNLPCSATASSCSTKVKFIQGTNTYTASCTGNSSGLQLNCKINIASATAGPTQLQVIVGSNTLTLPTSPLIGGMNVAP